MARLQYIPLLGGDAKVKIKMFHNHPLDGDATIHSPTRWRCYHKFAIYIMLGLDGDATINLLYYARW